MYPSYCRFISNSVVICNIPYPCTPSYSETVWRDVTHLLHNNCGGLGRGDHVVSVLYPIHSSELNLAKNVVPNAAVVTFTEREGKDQSLCGRGRGMGLRIWNPLVHAFISLQPSALICHVK